MEGYDNRFNSWIDKEDLIKMSQNFLKLFRSFGEILTLKLICLIMQQKLI